SSQIIKSLKQLLILTKYRLLKIEAYNKGLIMLLKPLNKELIHENLPNQVECHDFDNLPEKVIQIGEGNFLRGHVDWMIHEMNKKGIFNGRVVAIQPTPHGKVVPKLNAQDGLYTLSLRGIE